MGLTTGRQSLATMTPPQQALYQAWFRLAYAEKKGAEFEAWFADLASHALGSDFEPVAAHGSDGDFKCDGRRWSTRTIFQCYAPERLDQRRTIAKIDDDFRGALHHWHGWMQEWTLVHNRKNGLPPQVLQHLDQLRTANPEIRILVWGLPQLERELFSKLDLKGCRAVFGPVPLLEAIDQVTIEDLVPVIEDLQQESPEPNPQALDPPSAQKLQRNALSEDVADLLKAGRRKEALVERYFNTHPSPDLGEKIAVAFRRRYGELRERDLSPDDIFAKLQQSAGGGGSPKRQTAALAVLSYYFERCDIFEDADGE